MSAEVAAVEFTVRVTVCAAEPVIFTEFWMVQVAGSLAAIGDILQLKLTVPVNPPVGVRAMVEVIPEEAPGATVIGVPVMENPGWPMVYPAEATGLRE